MYNRLKQLYDSGKLSATGLFNAVGRGWITETEYNNIVGGEAE